ncbi:MAG: TonB-dependent receptor [Bacteroidetes bacterium]|nr:TonB-dependent receptor [Bacteroidota bacterium]
MIKDYLLCTAVVGLLFSAKVSPAQTTTDSDSLPKNKVLSEVVITGTRTYKRQTESPVIVSVINQKTLYNLQACNLAEGLKFQPGLRIETNCQTCNYTQLRMNGLQGGYSQILINGRPLFSPLMSLYSMEQIPANMIERIEVVRGGGSSLYGSSAIGGTVNVITRRTQKNGFEIQSFYQHTGNQSPDWITGGNATVMNKNGKAGTTLFFNTRNRAYYDANNDGFSELSQLKSKAAGLNSFYKISPHQKIEFNAGYINEYRSGGEMTGIPVEKRQQAEERTHHIALANMDYQINFNNRQSSFIFFAGAQHTDRSHYTGILPDIPADISAHFSNPPYGNSFTTSLQGGIQLNHQLNIFKTRNVLTIGSEYLSEKVNDVIPAYRYAIRQHTRNWGTFIQSDWDISQQLNLLSGIRIDRHNFLSHWVGSPRVALLYKFAPTTQFRLSYGTGFRAPQAFDTDLHIAFAAGGVSRVQLSDQLREEYAQSWSASFNYDQASADFIAGFTLEAFSTRLQHAFVLEEKGNDPFGLIFEKRNGSAAKVRGLTLEVRANYKKRIQLESGFTLQRNLFTEPVAYIEGIAPTRNFLRTPSTYGFANLQCFFNKKWQANINYVYTGSMEVLHVGGAENFPNDALINTRPFSEINLKINYTFELWNSGYWLECFAGIRNLLNDFQSDFDRGKNRDSNYIYGPAQPFTFFTGLKFR